MFLLLYFLIQINAIQTGSCGKECRYQYNETSQKLKMEIAKKRITEKDRT